MNLPPEVIAEILSWLPVKSILRLRCVSKSWYSLITDSNFITLHLTRSTSTKTTPNLRNRILIFEQSRYENEDPTISFLPFPDDDAVSGNASQIHRPFRAESVRMFHCDGLAFVTRYWANVCVLWNPLLRKQKVLTLPRFEGRHFPGSVILVDFGFGFDLLGGDYKIVRLVLYAEWDEGNYWQKGSWTSEVKVYSLRTNSWRRVPDLPFNDLKPCTPSVHVNGAIHWLVCDGLFGESPRFVVAFDLANEEYHKYLVPDKLEHGSFSCLGVLDGCLCLCLNNKPKVRQEFWLMKEYGVHESWCRLFVFEQCELPCKPLLLSKTGDKVLIEEDNKKLFWYDCVDEKIETVSISGVPSAFKATVCGGSLLLLDADNVQTTHL